MLFRMQVRLVLLFHSSCSIQRVYRGHMQRLAFATALRTGCFTTVSDSSHDRAARRAARPGGKAAVAVGARGHKLKVEARALTAEQVTDAHGAERYVDRMRWPPSAADALACLRLIRLPGPRVLKGLGPGKQQKERRQLAKRILAAPSSVVPEPAVTAGTAVHSIGISVVSTLARNSLCFYRPIHLPADREPPADDSASAAAVAGGAPEVPPVPAIFVNVCNFATDLPRCCM